MSHTSLNMLKFLSYKLFCSVCFTAICQSKISSVFQTLSNILIWVLPHYYRICHWRVKHDIPNPSATASKIWRQVVIVSSNVSKVTCVISVSFFQFQCHINCATVCAVCIFFLPRSAHGWSLRRSSTYVLRHMMTMVVSRYSHHNIPPSLSTQSLISSSVISSSDLYFLFPTMKHKLQPRG